LDETPVPGTALTGGRKEEKEMGTAVGMEADFLNLLGDLTTLDCDTIGAYD
jgi:hypothetical protein